MNSEPIWIFPAIFMVVALVVYVIGKVERRHAKTKLENRIAARKAFDEGRAL